MEPGVLLPGTLFDDKFVVIESLGAGGMGSVYKTRQIGLDREVALKLLSSTLVDTEDSVARFEREAKILSLLTHPNIAKFFQFGISSDNPYLVMECVKGVSLRKRLQQETQLDWKEAVAIVIQICSALSYAHKNGVIHRDLKPENILLESSSKRMVLIDFGLAKITDPQQAEIQKLTRTGDLVGSVHYLSPELCSGAKADARADIYALGVILYELISGTQPFTADSPMGIVYKHANEEPPTLSAHGLQFPVQLEHVIFTCLAKGPSKRYQSAEALLADLQLLAESKFDLISAAEKKKRQSIAAPALIAGALVLVAWLILKLSNLSAMNSMLSINAHPGALRKTASPELRLRATFDTWNTETNLLDPPKVIEEIDKVIPDLKNKNSLFVAYYVRGFHQYQLWKHKDAIKSFDSALALCHKDGQRRFTVDAIQVFIKKAYIYIRIHKTKMAKRVLTVAQKILRASQKDDTYPALELIDGLQYPKEDPQPTINLLLAQVYEEEADFGSAFNCLQDARAYYNTYHQVGHAEMAALEMANVLEQVDDREGADKLVSSLSLDGYDSRQSSANAVTAAEACHKIGGWYAIRGNPKKAFDWYHQGLEISTEYKSPHLQKILNDDIKSLELAK